MCRLRISQGHLGSWSSHILKWLTWSSFQELSFEIDTLNARKFITWDLNWLKLNFWFWLKSCKFPISGPLQTCWLQGENDSFQRLLMTLMGWEPQNRQASHKLCMSVHCSYWRSSHVKTNYVLAGWPCGRAWSEELSLFFCFAGKRNKSTFGFDSAALWLTVGCPNIVSPVN